MKACRALLNVRLIRRFWSACPCVNRGSQVSFSTLKVEVLISAVGTVHVKLKWHIKKMYDKTTNLRLPCSKHFARSSPVCENQLDRLPYFRRKSSRMSSGCESSCSRLSHFSISSVESRLERRIKGASTSFLDQKRLHHSSGGYPGVVRLSDSVRVITQ